MSSKKRVIGFIAALVLLGSVIAILRQSRTSQAPATPTQEWFYDLNAKKLFEVPRGSLPPLAAPSGPLPDGSPAGVRAYVYGCGGCSEANRHIGYLETFSAQDKPGMENQQRQLIQLSPDGRGPGLQAEPNAMAGNNALIKRPDDKEWVGRASKEGNEIVAEATRRCANGAYPNACQPGN